MENVILLSALHNTVDIQILGIDEDPIAKEDEVARTLIQEIVYIRPIGNINISGIIGIFGIAKSSLNVGRAPTRSS